MNKSLKIINELNKIIKNKPTYVRSHVQHQDVILMSSIYNFIWHFIANVNKLSLFNVVYDM